MKLGTASFIFILVSTICSVNFGQATTALESLAASLQPGTWAVLSDKGNTSGFGVDLLELSGGHTILEWTDKAAWDPVTRQLLFIGQGHYDLQRFITYSDDSNRWAIEPKPYWDCSDKEPRGNCIGHGYEHNAIDPAHREFFYRVYNSTNVYKYNIDKKTWSQLPTVANMAAVQCCGALEYFPELGGLIFVNGGEPALGGEVGAGVYVWKRANNQWSKLGSNLKMGSYGNFASYNPVHKIILFGGGGSFKNLYKLDTAGKITSVASAPVGIELGASILTVDPVSGKYLLVNDGYVFYEFDITTEVWRQLDASLIPQLSASANDTFGAVATPVSTHGVIMFIGYNFANSKVYLYKHSTRTSVSATTSVPREVEQTLSLSPQPDVTPNNATPLPDSSDFATRCAAAGVIKCVGFDQASDIARRYPANSGITLGATEATIDTSVKASGNGSMKFTLPPNSDANTSGSYFTNFSNDLSTQFGENSEFYVQWRQRFSPEFITNNYEGAGGFKHAIIGTGDKPGKPYASCTDLEVVVNEYYNHGFPTMYNSCSGSASHGAYDGFQEPFNGYDFKLQNARPSPLCAYLQGQTKPPSYLPPKGNCFGYFPNEWMTFQVHIKPGPRVGNEFAKSYVQLWIAREGRRSELVINWGPYNLSAGSVAENQKFGKVWLLPYNTGRKASVTYPTAYTWYDELIISKNRIADPDGSALAPSR